MPSRSCLSFANPSTAFSLDMSALSVSTSAIINKAGGGALGIGRLREYSEEDWDRVSDTFLKSAWRCMKHEIEHMLPNHSGVIINNASVAGLVGTGLGAYAAMKHGVVGLTNTNSV